MRIKGKVKHMIVSLWGRPAETMEYQNADIDAELEDFVIHDDNAPYVAQRNEKKAPDLEKRVQELEEKVSTLDTSLDFVECRIYKMEKPVEKRVEKLEAWVSAADGAYTVPDEWYNQLQIAREEDTRAMEASEYNKEDES